MSERPSEQQVNAFVDGELPLTEQLEMERRVAEDTALRTQVESLRALRRAVREQADYHAAPDALRARLRALTASAGALPPRPCCFASGFWGRASPPDRSPHSPRAPRCAG